MGNIFKRVVMRIFEYTIQKKPICFFRQEEFSSTGEHWIRSVLDKEPTEYEYFIQTFYESLKSKRQSTKLIQEPDQKNNMQMTLERYPGWDEMTLTNLHNLFNLFEDSKNTMLSLDDFCALLESLGDNSPYDVRNSKFDEFDTDKDGWLTYGECIQALYNFQPPHNGYIQGVAKLCFDAAENIRFVNTLTVAEQLEYGLF